MRGNVPTSGENKTIARQYFEAINQRDLDSLDEVLAPDFVDHTAVPDQAPGIEGLKQFFAMLCTGFPDCQATVEDVVSEEDRVAVRFSFRGTHQGELMDIAPTGRQVMITGIDIFRIADGKIVELWGQEDMLGMMQQLGVVSDQAGT